MTSILRRPSPARYDLRLEPPPRGRERLGVTEVAAVLVLMVLVAAGLDAILLGGCVMAGIRDHVRPTTARWERALRDYRLRP